MLRPRPCLAAPGLALLLAAAPARGQGQAVDVRLQVPGIGQPVATGPYDFKFALVDGAETTLWSHDGTSVGGSEPRSSVTLLVDSGSVRIRLGDGSGGIPPVPEETLQRDDVALRVWVGNVASTSFRRLPDRRLQGRGYAYAAQQAKNAEMLEGKRASDFEPAGAVSRHEQAYQHFPWGRVPGGRFYHGSTELGAGREVSVHFDVTTLDARLRLALHGSRSAAPPGIAALKLATFRVANQPAAATLEVVDLQGPGWLGGIREGYAYCNTCFKRKLPPETEVLLDGMVFEEWKAGRRDVPPGASTGSIDNLLPLGLVRFERSLKVTSRSRGVDEATGETVVWLYREAAEKLGAPGALEVRLDGADLSPALSRLAEAGFGARSVAGKLLAQRFDGPPPPTLATDPYLSAVADETWLGPAAQPRARCPERGCVVLFQGELELAAGDHVFRLGGTRKGLLELVVDGQVMGLGGTEAAHFPVPRAGRYPVRLLGAAAGADTVAFEWTVDDVRPPVSSGPLLGGEGGEGWSTGGMPLEQAGIALPPGPHVLTFRERAGRSGHLEYSLLVD